MSDPKSIAPAIARTSTSDWSVFRTFGLVMMVFAGREQVCARWEGKRELD
jgi:hypothetical protein